ncbi:MAG: glycosyltransferase family 9 protein [Verrucomicrobiota bacterium]|nr:glycosyltransferase family 9 protein [Verrucomicrobiota bacterium]
MLTLPAIKLLRENFPQARIEILGYKHIVALAEKRFYADATRSIEYGALAGFFARNAELPNELSNYFASFDLILSYLFDPDQIFATNLRRCGVEQLIVGPAKLNETEHAAKQLARPLTELDLTLRNPTAEIFPTDEDRANAEALVSRDFVAIHPGSGSETKNWPMEKWIELGKRISTAHLVVVAGEADDLAPLREAWCDRSVSYLENQPLPIVAAVLSRASHFIGHDSGISHIAAAVGTKCTLLFGPTDPAIWAPQNDGVAVLLASNGSMSEIPVETVLIQLSS